MIHPTHTLPAEMQMGIDAAIEAATSTPSLADEAVVMTPGNPTTADTAGPFKQAAPKPQAKAKPAPEEQASYAKQLRERLLERQKAIGEREQRTRARMADVDGARAQVRQWEARHSQHAQDLAAAQADPLGWLRDRWGMTPDHIANRLITGKEDPAWRASREAADLRAQVQRMEAQQYSQGQERELVRFVGEARADAERWPLASRFSESRLRERGMQIATSARAPISNAEILDRIEGELSEIANLRSPPAAAKSQPARNAGARNVVETPDGILVRRER